MSYTDYKQSIIERLNKLTERDKKALFCLSGFCLSLLILYGIILPTVNYQNTAKSHFEEKRQLYHWLQSKEHAVSQLPATAPKKTVSSNASLTQINESAKALQLTLKRVQPSSDGGQRIWIENAKFSTVIKWIDSLDNLGLSITELNMDRQAPGVVNLRLTIQN